MRTEKEKMLSGELYDASDAVLASERRLARKLFREYNSTGWECQDQAASLLSELLPHAGKGLTIEPPFHCDYGYNIFTGGDVYFNFNCILLDVMPIRIGNRVLMGPNVQLYTASHPLSAIERAKGPECAEPISIGDDCWFGGGAIVLPGVSIGDRCVIAAGAVVTKDVPSDSVVGGNPARILRSLDR